MNDLRLLPGLSDSTLTSSAESEVLMPFDREGPLGKTTMCSTSTTDGRLSLSWFAFFICSNFPALPLWANEGFVGLLGSTIYT